ncbi:hypothetical protein RRF57_004717 [Xylaria bambusicola]|uniref:ER-bound oxygenase mpaB/mpaB'/Rubber oxygenase catalytic domain-containing protein n=1 Tax=Xylaria bambusicola TaxID=326684 RepID=A0AAN7Z4L0_9PEZI
MGLAQDLWATPTLLGNQGWRVWAFTAMVGYVVICTTLRHSQKRAIQQKFNFRDRSSLAKMTLEDAYAIQTWLAEQQFPSVFSAAIFFALFKTYSIPSISRLLAATRQFGKPGDIQATSKRAADTSVLLTNMIMRPPGSSQAKLAVARTNYLHNIYRRTGRLSNDDMLFTLSLFTLQPMRWTAMYDWRPLSDMERCALATCFKVWGEDLEISYETLPSHSKGWIDGLHWLEELDAWSRQYEERHVEASDSNVEVVNATRELVLCQVPRSLHNLVWGIVAILLGPQIRKAMTIPEPSYRLELAFRSLITLRKFILRYASPPRPYFLRRVYNCERPDPNTGRYQSQRWLGRPWYVKTSLLDRWGLPAWMLWMNGTSSSTVFNNENFIPEGYLIEDVGPASHVGKGHEEMRDTLSALSSKSTTRCPFIH